MSWIYEVPVDELAEENERWALWLSTDSDKSSIDWVGFTSTVSGSANTSNKVPLFCSSAYAFYKIWLAIAYAGLSAFIYWFSSSNIMLVADVGKNIYT